MIKVIHIISDKNIGGAGIHLLGILKYIDRDIFDVSVILPQGAELFPAIRKLGVRIFTLSDGINRSFDIKGIYRIMRILKREKPDIVHTHACASGRLAAFLCRTRVRIMTRHCPCEVPKIMKNRIIRTISGFINKQLTDFFIATADIAKENLIGIGVPENRITVIVNGCDAVRKITEDRNGLLRREIGIGSDDFVVGIVARLEACKNHAGIIRAVNLCQKSFSSRRIRLLVVGDGSLREEIKSLAEAELPDTVFVGFVSDVAPYFNIMNLNLNFSVKAETSNLALSEGMSIGLPAVVSNSGGNSFMIKNNVNGIVVPEGDISALAAAIMKLEASEQIYRSMSLEAKRRYKELFTAREMSRKTAQLYLELYNK